MLKLNIALRCLFVSSAAPRMSSALDLFIMFLGVLTAAVALGGLGEEKTVLSAKEGGRGNISPDTRRVRRVAQPATTGPLNICK